MDILIHVLTNGKGIIEAKRLAKENAAKAELIAMVHALNAKQVEAVISFIRGLVECRVCGHAFNWWDNVVDDSIMCPECQAFNGNAE